MSMLWVTELDVHKESSSLISYYWIRQRGRQMQETFIPGYTVGRARYMPKSNLTRPTGLQYTIQHDTRFGFYYAKNTCP
jgi:hypothetical protein